LNFEPVEPIEPVEHFEFPTQSEKESEKESEKQSEKEWNKRREKHRNASPYIATVQEKLLIKLSGYFSLLNSFQKF
jgi:hypothetical protein